METYGGRTKNFIKTNHGDSTLIITEPIWDDAKTDVLEDGTILISAPIKTNFFQIMGQSGNLEMVMENKNGYYKAHYIGQRNNNDSQKILTYNTIGLFKAALTQAHLNTLSTSRKRLNMDRSFIDASQNSIDKINKLSTLICTDYYTVTIVYIDGMPPYVGTPVLTGTTCEWYDTTGLIYFNGDQGSQGTGSQGQSDGGSNNNTNNNNPKVDSLNNIMRDNCLTSNQLVSLSNLLSRYLSGEGNTEWSCLRKKQYNLMIEKNAKFGFCTNSNSAVPQSYNPINESFTFANDFSFSFTNIFEHEFFHAYQDKFTTGGTNQYAVGTSNNYPEGYVNIEFETAVYQDITRDRTSQDAFVNPDVPQTIRTEYQNWLNTITANNTKYPKTMADFGGQYFYFLEKFKQYSGYSNKGNIKYDLNPTSLLNLFSTSNCK